MGQDLLIKLDELALLRDQLASIITEFESSGDGSAQLADAVETPDGRTSLRDGIGDFHDNWKIHRRELTNSLQAVYDQVSNTHDEWVKLDESLGPQVEGAAS